MKVFLSSLISGMEAMRDAAASAVATLGHQTVRAEDFGASPDSPQQACLAGVRASDALILVLGSKYGHPQASGLSATHEEYQEARDTRPVLVMLQAGLDPEPSQAAFIREVQGWEHGHFTATFKDADDLRDKVVRALHDFQLANETSPLDEAELASRAAALVPSRVRAGEPELVLVVATGPLRAVLRPAELESDDLRRFVLAEALTGSFAVLDPAVGTEVTIRGDALSVHQSSAPGLVALDESGNLVIVQPATEPMERFAGISSIIEEVVGERLTRAIQFSSVVLERVDPIQRISHISVAAALLGAGYMPWRTRAEQQHSPSAASMGVGGTERVAVQLSPPVRRRAALQHDTQRLAEDLTVKLRREVTQR